MSALTRRLIFWAVPLGVLGLVLTLLFRPQPVLVDVAMVERGPLVSSVTEDGETRIKDVFTLSAPMRGLVRRIELDEGDRVVAGETVVAEIEPADPVFLDARTQAEAKAAVSKAAAALELARAELVQIQAELDFARSNLRRARTLRQTGAGTERALDDAERSYRIHEAALMTARAAIKMRQSELAAAEIRSLRPDQMREATEACPCIPVPAPVDGAILRVLRESEGVVEAGEPLVEIGDPANLEIVADFLSPEAVRIQVGDRAIIENWGGDSPLSGLVSRIEPFGFTKVSALGVEEQRVSVVVDFSDPPERWARLAHGFQLDISVILSESDDALQAPLTALSRQGDGWSVFAIEGGQAVQRIVEIGVRDHEKVEIRSGLQEGDRVVRYPSDQVRAGVTVEER
ncbi:MAG: HlyD family efflux transporter periplasmic adaptor subunit [Alphaproteobacteria bacterium]|nr:HlyD family efflux transporter periplasmic adaptor subunit [Alphaproteobacteria bacterium]